MKKRLIKTILVAAAVILPLFAFSGSGLPSKSELKKKLTPEQYSITQEAGTEQPFHNAYWNNHEDGIYVDLVTSEPLFSSIDKYDSGTGWPSFTRPITDKKVNIKKDTSLLDDRNEVLSSSSDSHLGHVFDDGPKDKGGQRFCINSGAMKFIPLDKLKETGNGRFLFMFAKKKHWEIATLAGGCFWGMEHLLQTQPGVIETQTGYTGGTKSDPSYEDVSSGTTGHAESVQILFDPKVTTYENLLVLFFKMHDPTTKDRQENDIGSQYRSAIFYESEAQKNAAIKMKARVETAKVWKAPVVTEIVPFTKFWRAEEHHQNYLADLEKKGKKGYSCHYVRNIKF